MRHLHKTLKGPADFTLCALITRAMKAATVRKSLLKFLVIGIVISGYCLSAKADAISLEGSQALSSGSDTVVDLDTAQFNFEYKNCPTNLLPTTLQFGEFAQPTSHSGRPVATAIALFTFSIGTLDEFARGRKSTELGRGEELELSAHQTAGSGGGNQLLGHNGKNDGTSPVPEPATMLFLGTGLVGVGVALRRGRTIRR